MQNRFVTYMYAYINGKKDKNVGFSKVSINNKHIKMETHIQNIGKYSGIVKTYALVENHKVSTNSNKTLKEISNTKEPEIIELGNLTIANGAAGGTFTLPTQNIIGIRIEIEENFFIASCWKEERANIIAGKLNFNKKELEGLEIKEDTKNNLLHNNVEQNVSTPQSHETVKNNNPEEKESIYKTITLEEIKKLPQKNWHYRSNRFLLHSYSNYKYLIIKNQSLVQNTQQNENNILNKSERYYIGVPGIYSRYMNNLADMFGFNYFEIQENDETEKENPQKNTEGKFGYWLSEIDMAP